MAIDVTAERETETATRLTDPPLDRGSRIERLARFLGTVAAPRESTA